MLPLKRILWPTDFSGPAGEALGPAAELAEHFGAELLIVHVIDPMPVVPTPPGPLAMNVSLYVEERREEASRLIDGLKKSRIPEAVKVTPLIVEGPPADEIAHRAKDFGADLIVMATHGETGWRHALFGSIAEHVLRASPCPVLLIRAPREEAEKRK